MTPLLLLLFLCLGSLPTLDQALASTFPSATATKVDLRPTPDQLQRVRALSGADPGKGPLVFEMRQQGRLVGVAYVDSHKVHSAGETAVVSVAPEGRILRVEVIVFKEPLDYEMKGPWLKQLEGKTLSQDLAVGKGVRPISGATLTALALVQASRRALAWHQVLYGGRS